MKALLTIAIFAFCSSSFAWVSHDAATKEYTFKYKLSGQSLEIKKAAGSYEEAYEMASQQCFSFYKGPNKVSETRGLDIIDVCANPRS
jgi:hypothetical protein